MISLFGETKTYRGFQSYPIMIPLLLRIEWNPQDKKKRLGDRHQNMLSHSFRKFLENKCLESGIDPFFASVLMGHKAGIGVERHYYRPTAINGENSLLELYVKKAMPYLTISEESRLKLKNRELEMRTAEDERRIKEALEERDKISSDSISAMSDQLMRLMKEMEALKKQQNQNQNQDQNRIQNQK